MKVLHAVSSSDSDEMMIQAAPVLAERLKLLRSCISRKQQEEEANSGFRCYCEIVHHPHRPLTEFPLGSFKDCVFFFLFSFFSVCVV